MPPMPSISRASIASVPAPYTSRLPASLRRRKVRISRSGANGKVSGDEEWRPGITSSIAVPPGIIPGSLGGPEASEAGEVRGYGDGDTVLRDVFKQTPTHG